MINEPFAAGDSLLHRSHPRLRLVAAVVFSAATAPCMKFQALALALLCAILLAALARLKAGEVFKRLLVVNGLVVFMWLVIPFTFPGETWVRLGLLTASRPGVELAAAITLKSNAIVLAFMALVATMPFATLGYALHRLRVPDKLVHLTDDLPLHLRHRAGIPAAGARGPDPGISAGHQSAYLPHLRLPHRHVVRAGRRPRRTGALGHDLPGIQAQVLLPSGIQGRGREPGPAPADVGGRARHRRPAAAACPPGEPGPKGPLDIRLRNMHRRTSASGPGP